MPMATDKMANLDKKIMAKVVLINIEMGTNCVNIKAFRFNYLNRHLGFI